METTGYKATTNMYKIKREVVLASKLPNYFLNLNLKSTHNKQLKIWWENLGDIIQLPKKDRLSLKQFYDMIAFTVEHPYIFKITEKFNKEMSKNDSQS
jgi:hypothetical protein